MSDPDGFGTVLSGLFAISIYRGFVGISLFTAVIFTSTCIFIV